MTRILVSLGTIAAMLLSVLTSLGQSGGTNTLQGSLQNTTTLTIEEWTLKQCIEYAIENNISIQQASLRGDDQAVRLNTAKNSRLPGLSASLGGNSYFGRGPSRDGTYQDNTQLSASGSLSFSVPIFSGMSINNNIKARTLDLQASLQDIARAKEDVALQVTSLYLQVLFNREVLGIAKSQAELSRTQLTRSELLLANGKSAESDVYESRALLAKDELTVIQSQNTLTLSLLDLAQALNLEQHNNFNVKMPQLNDQDVMSLTVIETPQKIYDIAVGARPRIKAEELRLLSSQKSLQIAKASQYPQVSLGAGYSNSAYYSFVDGYDNKKFFNQLKNNGSESIGLNISIPIFNKFSTRNQIRSAKIAIQNQQLTLADNQRALYKEIEQSYYSAVAAFEKYRAATKSVDAAKLAFQYVQQKADAGRMTIFDFNDAKTRLERSESESVQAKFEFVFRCKILDFYTGAQLEFPSYLE